MRKAVFLAVFLLAGLVLQAAPVSRSRALEVAKLVFAAQPATKAAGEVKLIWDGEDVATKAAVQPAFYVFGRDGGGFVIIAGDDNVRPVLALSQDSPFVVAEMPDNVKWWMDRMKAHVRSALIQSPEAARQWADLVVTKAKLDESLLSNIDTKSATPCWSQWEPANLNAPIVAGQTARAVCGCVPLAVAEVMTWHGWPDRGTGTAPAYSYEPESGGIQQVPSVDLTGFVMTDEDWAALRALDTYAKFQDCQGTVRSKVAELVYDCGVILKATFNDADNGGTGAVSQYIPALFAEYMKFNRGARSELLSHYSLREWNARLKAEVLQRPVLYGGAAHAPSGDYGHAYVLDGYATLAGEDVFHFNFGWGGQCNGYYYAAYQDLNGTDGQTSNFNVDLEAILDFVPDRTGTSKAVLSLGLKKATYTFGEPLNFTRTFYGIQADGPVQKGDVNLNICFDNRSGQRYLGTVKVVLEDKDGTEKEVLKTEVFDAVNTLESWETMLYLPEEENLTITRDLAFGDRIVLYYTDDDAQTHYVRMGGAVDGSVVLEMPVMPVAFIRTEDAYSVGDYFPFLLMNYDAPYLGTTWTVTDPDGTVNSSIPQSQREFKLTKSGTYKIRAAVAPEPGATVVEAVVTYITVN